MPNALATLAAASLATKAVLLPVRNIITVHGTISSVCSLVIEGLSVVFRAVPKVVQLVSL
jgi:hypothetical protein